MHLHDTSFRKSAVSMKVRKDRRFTRNGLRNIPNTQKSEKVRWGRVTSADFFCLRHYPSHTFTAKPPLKKYVFVQCPFGGGEGNRTPVQKPSILTFYTLRRFYYCRLLLGGVTLHTGRLADRYAVDLSTSALSSQFSFKALPSSELTRVGRCLFGALMNAYRIKQRELRWCRMLFDVSLLSGTAQSTRAYQNFKSLSKPLRPH